MGKKPILHDNVNFGNNPLNSFLTSGNLHDHVNFGNNPLNSFLTSGNLYYLLITFANSLDPDQVRHFVGLDLDPNCLTLRLKKTNN